MKTASQYVRAIQHELRGDPDSRLPAIDIVNQALKFLVNMHDWKFRKRDPLDVSFQAAGIPTVQTITAIARASNVVTLTVAASPSTPFSLVGLGATCIVTGCTDSSFNGTFTVTNVVSPTQIQYTQAGSNATSSGGLAGPFAYEQFIDLPADFGQLLAVCTKNNAIANTQMTSLEEIAWRRGSPNSVAYDGLYRCALSFPGQPDHDSAYAIPRLQIWPRPTASNAAGDLTLNYRARAVPVVNAVAPTVQPIASIVRISNSCTIGLSAAPTQALSTIGQGRTLIVSGASDTSFNGTFTLSSVTSPTAAVYAQTASNGTLTNSGYAGPVAAPRDDVPNIPDYFERLLELLCRLFAQGYEEGQMTEQPAIQTEVAMLVEADGAQQTQMGMLQGGAVQRKRVVQLREFQRITNPSNRL